MSAHGSQLGRADVELVGVALLLCAAGLLALRVHGHVADARGELRKLRGADKRAAELAASASKRDDDVDGLLAKVSQLAEERDLLLEELEIAAQTNARAVADEKAAARKPPPARRKPSAS